MSSSEDKLFEGLAGAFFRRASALIFASFLISVVACKSPQSTETTGQLTSVSTTSPTYYTEIDGRGVEVNSASITEAEVREFIEGAASDRGQTLQSDSRLVRFAEWIHEHTSERQSPSHRVLSFVAHRLGLTTVPHYEVRREGRNAPVDLRGTTLRFLESPHRYNVYGAFVDESTPGRTVVVTFAQSMLDLEPVPREVESRTLSIIGTVRAPFVSPELIVTPPGSAVQRLPLSGSSFSVEVPFEAAGEYQVEIIAEGPVGPTVLANFPVYFGVSAPSAVELEGGIGENSSPHAVEGALLSLINEERRDRGLSELARDSRLDELAQAHSADMIATGFVGHRSPNTGDLADRLRAAGISAPRSMENIGRARGATEIHEGLMGSPGHRGAILSPEVTHVGLGVVEQDGDFFTTQVFIQVSEEVNTGQTRDAIFDALAAEHEGLNRDAELERAAQSAADRYFASPNVSQQAALNEATRSLSGLANRYAQLGAMMTVVASSRDAVAEAEIDPGMGGVGIGVAQGSRPDLPPNSIAVVILVGRSR